MWIKYGLLWGVLMFVILCLFFPWYDNKEITFRSTLSGLVIFGGGGLAFGYIMGKKNPDVRK